MLGGSLSCTDKIVKCRIVHTIHHVHTCAHTATRIRTDTRSWRQTEHPVHIFAPYLCLCWHHLSTAGHHLVARVASTTRGPLVTYVCWLCPISRPHLSPVRWGRASEKREASRGSPVRALPEQPLLGPRRGVLMAPV